MTPSEDHVPEFVRGSDLLEDAYRFARDAHHGPSRRGETDIDHPVAVAELLAGAGFDETVVASALLHDVVEDTSHRESEITARFPLEVAELVAVMTEDEAIDDYAERKAEHRERVLRAGRVPASIYLADKLARVRRYAAAGEPVAAPRLEHYNRTLEQFGQRDPGLPFVAELHDELPKLRADGEL
jgi:(p)ppGpp synthase/HD superfamily hydrolase